MRTLFSYWFFFTADFSAYSSVRDINLPSLFFHLRLAEHSQQLLTYGLRGKTKLYFAFAWFRKETGSLDNRDKFLDTQLSIFENLYSKDGLKELKKYYHLKLKNFLRYLSAT